MFARVLVPTDFSAPSDAALEYARVVVKAFGASLHVLHVLPNVFLRPMANDPHAIENGALSQLRDWLAGDDQRPAAASVARSDEPPDEIVSYARSNEIDLIVMGTHGRSGVTHFLVGSVAETVVRTAPCPVLTLHSRPASLARGPQRILVPTDFSASADAALDMARSFARQFGSSIHLLHVLAEAPEAGGEMFVAESPEARTDRLQDAIQRLGHRVAPADHREITARTEVVFGVPSHAIVDHAAHEFDLIVMGTHGRKGIAHVLMGSVAERVVRHSSCPVITVRQPLPAAGVKPGTGTAAATSSAGRTSRSGSALGRD